MKHQYTLILAIFLIITSCVALQGTMPVQQEIDNSFSFSESTYSSIWETTLATFNRFNIPPQNMDNESGFINTDWIGLPQEDIKYADCGTPPAAHSFRNLEVKVNVQLNENESNVGLTVNTQFRADLWEGGLAQRTVEENRTCYSLGLLENEFFKRISSELNN